ncbi:unnamed protein product [Closterium sp. Yama58-4]|nr:unnamed protein product [Closterium sp. Yama58-4]
MCTTQAARLSPPWCELPFTTLVTDTLILNPSGQLVGVIGVSADISDIKRKEGEVRALNAALEEHIVERMEQLQRNSEVLRQEMEALLSAGSTCSFASRTWSNRAAAGAGAGADGGGSERESRTEAESANRLKSRILAPMSHENRTPIERRARCPHLPGV